MLPLGAAASEIGCREEQDGDEQPCADAAQDEKPQRIRPGILERPVLHGGLRGLECREGLRGRGGALEYDEFRPEQDPLDLVRPPSL